MHLLLAVQEHSFFIRLCNHFTANAQTDTIRLQDNHLITSASKPGIKQYLVYFQDLKNKKHSAFGFGSEILNRKQETV
jgi:hypothetical protein